LPGITTSEPFVDDVAAAFERAADGDVDVHALRLADRVVRVVSAGAGPARTYLSALAHLEIAVPAVGGSARCARDDADLTIHLWEQRTSGVPPPPPPWGRDDFLAGGRIRGHVRDGIRVTYADWARTLTVYDAARRRAYVHVTDLGGVPGWVLRAPLRNVLTWWASDRGLVFLHAAAVADARGAVVLAGPSGSGKSTTALACLADGLWLLGDDACIVDLSEAPHAFPVYRFAKLERDALARLPELEAFVVDPDAGQLLVDPADVPTSGVPLRSVLLPRVGLHTDTTISPVSRRDALHTLVAASLREGEGAGGTTLASLTRLVRSVALRRIELGSSRRGVVNAVRQVLASA
jgi:hypothetical protein